MGGGFVCGTAFELEVDVAGFCESGSTDEADVELECAPGNVDVGFGDFEEQAGEVAEDAMGVECESSGPPQCLYKMYIS